MSDLPRDDHGPVWLRYSLNDGREHRVYGDGSQRTVSEHATTADGIALRTRTAGSLGLTGDDANWRRP